MGIFPKIPTRSPLTLQVPFETNLTHFSHSCYSIAYLSYTFLPATNLISKWFSNGCLCLTFVCALCDCTHDLPIWPRPYYIYTFYHHYPFQHPHRCNCLYLHNLQWHCQYCHSSLVHVFSVHMKNFSRVQEEAANYLYPRLNIYTQIFFKLS
jgi:hypothetical protein